MINLGKVIRFSKLSLVKVARPIILFWENIYFRTDECSALQPTFIIGAPRTGSTILYQALTNAYRFAYIDNLACTWHRNLRFGLWLSRKRYGDCPHNNFKSVHGNTRKFGGHAPSECGQFWYRWLPMDRHFIDHDEVSPHAVNQMRAEVFGASNYLQRPLLFKNLNAGQRLRLIHRAFPDAKIIFVRRDPRFVTRSLLNARKKAGIPEDQWWSIMPPNVDELRTLPEGERCAAQVYSLERQIEQDLSLFPEENVKEIHYQTLNEDLVRQLGDWSGAFAREGAEVPEFEHDDPRRLQPEDLSGLERLIERYPFKKELFV